MEAEKAEVTMEEGAPRAKMSGESFDHALTHQTSVTDTEKGSSAYASSVGGGIHLQEYRKAERKLVRKLDMVILPLTMCMYLSAYLDRGNMGNARLQGLQVEVLGDDDIKYSVCLAAFYIAYIIFNIPGNIMAKLLPPATALSIACLVWGIAASCQASVTNYAGLVVCRLFIGIGEAGFGPTVPLYYSYWYKRNEIATRISLFIGCGALAGTFGGLIAYGVQTITGASLSDWRILFLIEGLPTVLLALVIFFCLPDRPETSKFITEEERTIANTRLNSQGLAEGPKNFHWPSLRHALTDYKNWMMACMYLGINLTLGSISGFLPTIIKTMGYSNVNAQLYTVPLYAVALVYMTIVSKISDRLKIRGLFVFMNGMVAAIGFIILITVQQNQSVRYFATFLLVAPTFTNIPLCLSWAANNNATESARAVALGQLNAIGQCFSVLASFVFPSSQSPIFITGMSLNLTFSLVTGLLGLALYIILKLENRRRDREEGPAPEDNAGIDVYEHFDKAPGFRYIA